MEWWQLLTYFQRWSGPHAQLPTVEQLPYAMSLLGYDRIFIFIIYIVIHIHEYNRPKKYLKAHYLDSNYWILIGVHIVFLTTFLQFVSKYLESGLRIYDVNGSSCVVEWTGWKIRTDTSHLCNFCSKKMSHRKYISLCADKKV